MLDKYDESIQVPLLTSKEPRVKVGSVFNVEYQHFKYCGGKVTKHAIVEQS